MKAVDSNVLVRFLLDDHPVESPQAERLIRGGVFVPDTVMLEVGWVLGSVYELKRAEVTQLLEGLVRLPNIEFADRTAIEEAVVLYGRGHDIDDAIHAATSFAHAKILRTFDKPFINKARRVKPRMSIEGV